MMLLGVLLAMVCGFLLGVITIREHDKMVMRQLRNDRRDAENANAKELQEARQRTSEMRAYALSLIVSAAETRVASAMVLEGAKNLEHWSAKSVDNSDLDADLVFSRSELQNAGMSQKAFDLTGF